MSILAALLLIFRAQDLDERRIEQLIRALDADETETRRDAETELVALGPRARPCLEAALPGASEETKQRIRSICARYVLTSEEDFALACLRRGDPFPPTPKGSFALKEGESVAQIVSRIAEDYELRIEFFPEDVALRREAEESRVRYSTTGRSANGLLSGALIDVMDAIAVVDGRRIVVVRLTPKLLLERLGQEREPRLVPPLELRWTSFHPSSGEYWGSMERFLLMRSTRPGTCEKWFRVLSETARNPSSPARDRGRAVRGLGWLSYSLSNIDGVLCPESERVVTELAADPSTEEQVRLVAVDYLGLCTRTAARETVFTLLATGTPVLQTRLLRGLAIAAGNGHFPWGPSGLGETQARRLGELLQKLEASPDVRLSLTASCLASILGAEGSLDRLLKQDPFPRDDSRALVLEALRIAALRGRPEISGVLDRLGVHPDPELRAAAAGIQGCRIGGRGRSRDVAAALALLGDPEPIVRACAAGALQNIYHPNADEPYVDGRDACLVRLRAALDKESQSRVLDALEDALRVLAQERSDHVRYSNTRVPGPLKK